MPFSSNGITACYNGEIYNHLSFSEGIADGEALLPAFQQHGIRLADFLDGEFALCIWDDRNGNLILSRDHFGTKPIYFGFDGKSLVWASSERICARLLERVNCVPKTGPAYQHTYSIQEPYTSFQGVWSIPPGHTLITKGTEITLRASADWPRPLNEFDDCVPTALMDSLTSRMAFDGTLAIPMSAGIDSGIIAFTAEYLGLPYHIFSVTKIFGQPTIEAPYIEQRLSRLSPKAVTLLDCNEAAYQRALETMFSESYYSSEYLDNSAILVHCLAEAVHNSGLRVLIDGTGGDELFDGYAFRNDLHCPTGWPPFDDFPTFNSLYSTLLAYTRKIERAGGHYSFEARYPFQTKRLLRAALNCSDITSKKPLRAFLLDHLPYGTKLPPDASAKYGFSMRGHDVIKVRAEMKGAWSKTLPPSPLSAEPSEFPFRIGSTSSVDMRWSHR